MGRGQWAVDKLTVFVGCGIAKLCRHNRKKSYTIIPNSNLPDELKETITQRIMSKCAAMRKPILHK